MHQTLLKMTVTMLKTVVVCVCVWFDFSEWHYKVVAQIKLIIMHISTWSVCPGISELITMQISLWSVCTAVSKLIIIIMQTYAGSFCTGISELIMQICTVSICTGVSKLIILIVQTDAGSVCAGVGELIILHRVSLYRC